LEDVGGVLGMGLLVELTTVPGVDEELDRVAQRLERAGETARAARERRASRAR